VLLWWVGVGVGVVVMMFPTMTVIGDHDDGNDDDDPPAPLPQVAACSGHLGVVKYLGKKGADARAAVALTPEVETRHDLTATPRQDESLKWLYKVRSPR
jgi:hypothetical protein